MSGKLLRIEPGALGVRLHDGGDTSVGQSRWLNAPALGDRPKHWAFGDGGGFEPSP